MEVERLYETYCLQGGRVYHTLSNYDDYVDAYDDDHEYRYDDDDEDYCDGHTDEDADGFCYDENDHLDTY